jgi:glycosyltransferase involved in cell wall biosynthesis
MRVVHVQKVSGVSGSEAHLLSALPLLRDRGWDVRMLMLHEGEEGAREFARRLHAPVEEVRMRRDLDPLAFAAVLRRLRALRPLIVHTHLVHGDVYGLPAAALLRTPLRVSTKHGFNEFRARPGFARADRAVARLAHVNVAISGGLARYLGEVEGFDADRFEIVHYGIEAKDEWTPYEGDEPRLLCLGRLIPIKGHAILLEALARARAEVPELALDIAGTGPLEQELRASAGEGVRFLGHVSRPAGAIEGALAVVVPSLGEGFGMVALEAMERGRAVVASAVGGLPELVVDGETGLLVPPGDADALAAALVEVARSPERARALGAAGRARAVAEFSAERSADRIDALYREALVARKRSSPAAASSASRNSQGAR